MSDDNIVMVDAAFTPETDPDYNPAIPFLNELTDSGIILHVRMVGDQDVVTETTESLWNRGMKLIVVTYCDSTKEQELAYERIKRICT